MKYEFPVITHLNDVLPAIEGAPEFIVADKGSYKVVNYLVSKEDTFPPVVTLHDAIRRECRGMVFDAEGNIVARRYHKFFNVNERPETAMHLIDLTQDHVLLEKLDGSMITPIVLDGEVLWGTKMGVTETVTDLMPFLVKNSKYKSFAKNCARAGMTPIFEWCSRFNRIVIDHAEPRLVLTAIRHNQTGEYEPYDVLKELGEEFNIEVVRAFEGRDAIEYLVNECRALEGTEGFVVRFADGHMLKIKSDWYCRIHSSKELFLHPRHLAALILASSGDDAKAVMLEEDRLRMVAYENAFYKDVRFLMKDISVELWEHNTGKEGDRKEYALSKKINRFGPFGSIVFKLWNTEFTDEEVIKLIFSVIEKYVGNNSKFDSLAPWLKTSNKTFIEG